MNYINYYIDAQNIINQDFLETVKELIVCSICHGIIVEPKQCENCENSFCNRCIIKYLENNTTCPNKCGILQMKEATRAVKNLLDKLHIRCSYCHDNTSYTYDQLIKHIRTCTNVKTKCLSCGSLVSEKAIKDNQVITELKEKIAKLTVENERLLNENNELYVKINKTNTSDGKTDLPGLKDKCKHFYGNYIPIFECCSRAFPCCECHDEQVLDHSYEFSNKVICLVCNNIYTGSKCENCKTTQVYRRK